MHYKNGRQANVGDLVVGKGYNIPGVIVGHILSITTSATGNCRVALVGDAAQPVKTEYSQCNNFYHAEDALALADAVYKKPEAKPTEPKDYRDDTTFPG